MDEFSTTSDTLDQADEEIFTPTLSDEALEAAAGTVEAPLLGCALPSFPTYSWTLNCLSPDGFDKAGEWHSGSAMLPRD
jgi:hypothetical protein